MSVVIQSLFEWSWKKNDCSHIRCPSRRFPPDLAPPSPIFPRRAAKRNHTMRVWRDMLAQKVVHDPVSPSQDLPRLEADKIGHERPDPNTSDASTPIIGAQSMANHGYSGFFRSGQFNGERAMDGVVQPNRPSWMKPHINYDNILLHNAAATRTPAVKTIVTYPSFHRRVRLALDDAPTHLRVEGLVYRGTKSPTPWQSLWRARADLVNQDSIK
ncbi:hypothetical protein B0H11DRAFT_1915545 [Mycena galericulata]|nr:hypothetical protein B0H11DRAFT_1915545 [Mycena galericulata]